MRTTPTRFRLPRWLKRFLKGLLIFAILSYFWEKSRTPKPGIRTPGSSPDGPGSPGYTHPPERTGEVEPAPIFIVGNGRTGTTLLQNVLSAHPRIYIVHELAFYGWERICPTRLSSEKFLHYYFRTLGFRWLRLDAKEILDSLPSPLPRENVALAMREIMKRKAASFGRIRYGDKTPANINSLPRIFKDFPDAKVLVAVRDPRATVASLAEMPWGSKRDLANCFNFEATSRNVLPYMERVYVVRLEDMKRDLEGEMRKILEFVGEPWDDAVLDHPNHDPDPGKVHPLPWLESSTARVVRTDDKARRALTPLRLKVIETVCAGSIKQFRYPASLPETKGVTSGRVVVEMVASLPETARYLLAMLRLAVHLRNPKHWEWENRKTQTLFRKINPDCWELYPDFEPPEAPPLVYGGSEVKTPA